MTWIVGWAVVLGFFYLMYANEKFRRFGFGVLALLGVAALVLWFTSTNSNRKYEERRQEELNAVRPADLTLTNMVLENGSYGRSLSGTVLNRSGYAIRSIKMKVSLLNCPSSASADDCIVTGQADAQFFMDVPSGQARQLATTVTFDNEAYLPGQTSWIYQITEIEAMIPRVN